MTATVIPTRFRLRRDTAANWTATNPTPLDGEPCLETDTGLRKLGDGSTAWNSLLYQLSGAAYDLANLAEGDTPIWDLTNRRWKHGPGGKIYQPGIGIAIDNPTTTTPTIRSTLGSIALSGSPATYAALPTGLGTADAGKAYLVQADGLIYIWSGTAWPAQGAGVSLSAVQPDPADSLFSSVTLLLRPDPATGRLYDVISHTTPPSDGTPAFAKANAGLPARTIFSTGQRIVVPASSNYDIVGPWCLDGVASVLSKSSILVEKGGAYGARYPQFNVATDSAFTFNASIGTGASTGGITTAQAIGLGMRRMRHFAVAYSGTTMSLYVDGTRVATKTVSPAPTSHGDALQIAGFVDPINSVNNASFVGSIAWLRITQAQRFTVASFAPPWLPAEAV